MRTVPTLKQAEKALGEPASAWKARCFEIASRIVAAGLVEGVAVYGHWRGPVAKGTTFAGRGTGFVQHGWVLLPDGKVLDPTRWCFEGGEPYLYIGPSDHYDEGGNNFREDTDPYPPEYDSFEPQLDFTQKILPSDAWNFVEKILRLDHIPEDWEPGTVTIDQARWLAKRSPKTLGPHVLAIYRALFALNMGALVPLDNRRMVERIYDTKFGEAIDE